MIKLLIFCLTIAGSIYIYQSGNLAIENRRADADELKTRMETFRYMARRGEIPSVIRPTPSPQPPF